MTCPAQFFADYRCIGLMSAMLLLLLHQIRFFERVKLERQIKQLEKSSSTEATEITLQERQHDLAKLRDDLQVNIVYVA